MATTSKKTTKISIPHTQEEGCSLVGVLEQTEPDEPTQGRKIALILHGALGHKDYLFQKRLALQLPLDSFRFDFRGAFESGGTYHFGGFHRDAVDLRIVVEYLKREFGYVVDLIVGHSRGVVVGLLWMCSSEEANTVRGFVNVAGRYRMRKIYDELTQHKHELDTQGYWERRAVVARQSIVIRITQKDVEEFGNIDTSVVWHHFPKATDVLTIHGMMDTVVPHYDAILYAHAYSDRYPGTHNLYYVEDADHNFTGQSDIVITAILNWWHMLEHKELKTGLWHALEKGRL